MLRGASRTVLVDPGWSSPETEASLHAGLAVLGLEPCDIDLVLVTHHHWDHYTQAITWQRTHGVPVHLGRGDAPSIDAWHTLSGAFPRQVGLLERAGAPDLARAVGAIPVEPHEQAMDFEHPAAWLDDGDELDCGGLTVRCVATPGHTRGHLCFDLVEEEMLLTGDHVLPRITPSIAYEREPDALSLVSYLGSLRLVTEMPGHAMLPAHGEPGDSAAGRAEELLGHHDRRLDLIADLVASGRSTPHDVASAMLWTRRDHSLADLGTVHGMTAVLETAAHLVVLQRAGRVELRREGGVDHYAPPGA